MCVFFQFCAGHCLISSSSTQPIRSAESNRSEPTFCYLALVGLVIYQAPSARCHSESRSQSLSVVCLRWDTFCDPSRAGTGSIVIIDIDYSASSEPGRCVVIAFLSFHATVNSFVKYFEERENGTEPATNQAMVSRSGRFVPVGSSCTHASIPFAWRTVDRLFCTVQGNNNKKRKSDRTNGRDMPLLEVRSSAGTWKC